ncbi:MAG: hypothetical protein ABIO81_03055 [Ginsengibacter sp.]
MKKTIGFLSLVVLLASCASDNDMKYKDTETKEGETENPVGIQNVNGNIPDTINTIDISTDNKKDTVLKGGRDSLK